jgi:hypothetical protein
MIIWRLADYHRAVLFSEDSVLEWSQFGTMLVGFVITFFTSFRIKADAVLLRILGMLCGLAAIRELDSDLDRLIPFFGWHLPFHLLLVTGLWMGIRHRKILIPQLRVFVAHRSFGMLWGGFMLAIPFGQMIGHGPFLQELFGDDFKRPMKRVIEECAETCGYLVILMGVIDFIIFRISFYRSNQVSEK